MPRIAIAGFQHETNTFGTTLATYDDFLVADSWPPLLTGSEVISGTRGINLPIAGFIEAAGANGDIELVPILWAFAEPCSHVTDDAFNRISQAILRGLREAGPIDGLYLDLHGAMVTESFEDGEGALLSEIRTQVGQDLPIAVSLDLHANISRAMVDHATSITIFRTYPHLDMAETGARSFVMLTRHLAGEPMAKAFRQAPFLLPIQSQFTGAAPCDALYAMLADQTADIALGFSAADIADAGPAVVAYAPDQGQADALADQLMRTLLDAEPLFDTALYSPEKAVVAAMQTSTGRPVVLADVQDNPGAGATSDTNGLLKALLSETATGAVSALHHDPEVAATARDLGIGAEFEAALGGRSGHPDDSPLTARFRVETLGSGTFKFTGKMYAGATAHNGPSACLRILDTDADIRVLVSSNRSQCLDQAIFTHLGISPAAQRILCVKSSVHYRADFDPIAGRVMSVAAPGLNPCQLDRLTYHNLRPGMRTMPLRARS